MKKNGFLFLFSLLTLTACHTQKDFNHIVGATVDEHGCRPSSGYSWSQALHQCVRLWEVAERLESGTQTAFLLFNADLTTAELVVDGTSYLCKRDKMQPLLWQSKNRQQRVFFNNGMKTAFINGKTFSAEMK